jgi:PAS domain S-box-containing protein
MLWLYLLGAVTFLIIVLRRVLRKQKPLNDALYSKQVAIDHVHSGVAWARADGSLGSVNPALAKIIGGAERELIGRRWESIFPEQERARMLDAHRQALLMGKIPLETTAERLDGTLANVNVLLVTVHDHKSRLIGHYCLVEDRTRELELEEQLRKLSPVEAEATQ